MGKEAVLDLVATRLARDSVITPGISPALNVMSWSKGKGKGKKGKEKGKPYTPLPSQPSQQPDARSGKQVFSGYCNYCWLQGHTQRRCPVKKAYEDAYLQSPPEDAENGDVQMNNVLSVLEGSGEEGNGDENAVVCSVCNATECRHDSSPWLL